jgi:crotonobetainyl-CoA:carnitine CoA-transferase CaiB-like acyl-CoA transferase
MIEGIYETRPTGALSPIAPLAGVRVVEFGSYASAPLAGMLLGEQGAQVVKIEPPAGDPLRVAPAFHVWNRGKRSVILDAADASGRAALIELVQCSDVFIENQPPLLLDQIGLSPSAALRRNPRLVYCSMPNFPSQSDGGELDDCAWETLVNARSGLAYDATYGASVAPPAIASCYGAILAAVDIAAALSQREATGRGQHVEVSLFAGALNVLLGSGIISIKDSKAKDPLLSPQLPMADIYQCSDGAFVQSAGTYVNLVSALLRVAGRPEWIEEASAGLAKLPDAASEQRWRERFAEFFAEKSADWWEQEVSKAGGACTRCREVREWWSEPHVQEAVLAQTVVDEEIGYTIQCGPAIRLDSTPVLAPRVGAPRLGASDYETVLAEFQKAERAEHESQVLGRPGADKQLPEAARPLEGVRVIDLCIVLAGPTCGRTLADLGAEVIKVDSLDRSIASPYSWLDVNRGKRSMRLDLKSSAGREILWRLIESADVFIENFRLGKMEMLGFGPDAVWARKRSVVYASMNAFDYGGPYSDRPGYEYNAQAASGLQTYGDMPQRARFPLNDYGTGLLSAFGVVMALRAVRRGEPGSLVRGSLARTASFLQSHNLMTLEGQLIPSDWSRLETQWEQFHTRDGKVWVKSSDVGRILQGTDSGEASRVFGSPDTLPSIQLAATLAAHTTADVLLRCKDIGVPVEPERRPASVPAVAGDFARSWLHDSLGEITQVVAGGIFSESPPIASWPAPLPGTDTRAILLESGFSDDRIQRFFEDGVVGGPATLFGSETGLSGR